MKQMETLKIKLKQHTPIIHFQHNQDGATLRATEVKPKLDRFILTKLGEGCYEKGKEKAKENGWLVGKGDHPALNYKMRIESNIKDDFLLKSIVSQTERAELQREGINYIDNIPVFGDNLYGLILTNICVRILSFNDAPNNLINEIHKYIIIFFTVTNFGFRESKGFGSFTVETIKKNNEEEIEVEKKYLNMIEDNFKYVYLKDTTDFKTALREIKADYQLLKAGVNFREYKKSLLFCYHQKEEKVNWEKRKIKEKMISNGITPYSKLIKNPDRSCKKCNVSENNNYKFIRALLGLAEHYEFNNSKINVKVDGGENFERFRSPITFKIIENTIYLLGNPIVEDIFSKSFSFQIYENINGAKVKKGEPFPLSTPETFNIRDFLEDVLVKGRNLNYIKQQSL